MPVATMGNQTKTRNNVSCKTESVTASRAQMPVRAATPAAQAITSSPVPHHPPRTKAQLQLIEKIPDSPQN